MLAQQHKIRGFALTHGIQKLEYATVRNPFAGKGVDGSGGQIFGRKVWNSTDESLRRIIWRCNGKYLDKGKNGCESRHIDDGVLYQACINVFNAIMENKDYFVKKWQERLKSDNVLVRYKSRQFIKILEEAKTMVEFDIAIYSAMVEKITVQSSKQVIVSLLDGTDIECEMK